MSQMQRRKTYFGEYLDIEVLDMKYSLLADQTMVLRKKVSLMTKYFILKLDSVSDITDEQRNKLRVAVHLILDKGLPKAKASKSCSLNTKEKGILDDLFPANFFKDLRLVRNAISLANKSVKERK